jgi:hypothetical protein
MRRPSPEADRATTAVLERIASGLKVGLIVTIYFSLCVLIILLFIGAMR